MRCSRCGSTARRANGKGCADCHLRASRKQWARKVEREGRKFKHNFEITPAMRLYLKAFDAYLMATKTGDPDLLRKTEILRELGLAQLLRGTE